jgi:hypothetical protein
MAGNASEVPVPRPWLPFVLALLGLPLAARAEEPPAAAKLWRDALAKGATWTLPSHDEPGYRLTITAAPPVDADGVLLASLSYQWSEINTEGDEPRWTKPRRIAPGGSLPAQVAITERGVFWLPKIAKKAALAKQLQRPPTFGPGVGTVTERRLAKGPAFCFAGPGSSTKKGGSAVELCLAEGAGIVAAKGVVAAHPVVLFAQTGWVAAE